MTVTDEAEQPARLYGKTEVLSLQRHGSLGLAAEANYGFASAMVSVPAALSEVVLAQRYYPVVFAGAKTPLPVIVLGLSEPSGNLFVGAEGHWAEHHYVPAFFRRYPFVALPKPGTEELVLAADVGSDLVVENGPRPFFTNGEASEGAKRAFELSGRLHVDFEAAREFAGALSQAGLLREQRAEISLSGAGRIELTNFLMIDEVKLNALPDETFLDWRRRGWLASIHAHLMSLASWGDLARRAGASLGSG